MGVFTKQYLILPIIIWSAVSTYGQCNVQKKVFLTGECQELTQHLLASHEISLLESCGNDMDLSYKYWLKSMKDVENYCTSQGFDIKGCKFWINIFWNREGYVEGIMLHPKPNSRNVNIQQLQDLLEKYIGSAKPMLVSKAAYSHNGSISFPVFYQAVQQN